MMSRTLCIGGKWHATYVQVRHDEEGQLPASFLLSGEKYFLGTSSSGPVYISESVNYQYLLDIVVKRIRG